MSQKRETNSPPVRFKSLGERLRWHRLHLGLSQEALAEALGVSTRSIRRWEQDQAIPQEFAREQLGQLFGIDSGQLPGALSVEAMAAVSLPFWLVPFRRNPFFTGRDDVLCRLDVTLYRQRTAIVSQSCALSGLGGIGKTQVAVEYAYRYGDDYTAIFWISADTAESLITSYVAVADLLLLPERQEQEQQKVVAAVTRWLGDHRDWLLIFDNVEDIELVKSMLPATRHGSLLITSRRQGLGLTAHTFTLNEMELNEGLRFLLHRAGILAPPAGLDQLAPDELDAARDIVAAMGGLPLAVDQAGAYIEAAKCSLSDYLHLFQSSQRRLLDEREKYADHPLPVTRTFALVFERLEQSNPAAAEMLTVCAFLAPEAIPEMFFLEGATGLGPTFEALAADPLQFQAALKALLSYSLLQRDAATHTLTIHRLVQAVLRGCLSEGALHTWVERVSRVMTHLFPSEVGTQPNDWRVCSQLLSHALACLALCEQCGEHGELRITLMSRVAGYLINRARYSEAEPLYERALRSEEQALGSEHPLIAEVLYRLATFYSIQGRFSEAEPLFQRALRIREQALGSEHPQLAFPLNNLAILYRHQGRFSEAESLLQRALHIREQVLGAEHPHVAFSLNNLAELYRHQGKYVEAEPLYERALRIREQTLGSEHPQLATSLSNLAELYTDQSRFTEAASLFERALHMWEQTLGSEHPHMAMTLCGLAKLYRMQGNSTEAEPLYERALHIWERGLPDHPDVALALDGLADLSREQRRYEQAAAFYHRALDMRERTLGSEHPDVARSLQGLATLYAEQGQDAQAESFYQRALVLRQKGLHADHPEVVESLHALANFYQQRRPAEALSLYQRALAIREQQLGTDHPDIAITLNDLATLYREQGRYEVARPLYLQALGICERRLGSAHPKTVEIRSNFNRLLNMHGV